MSLASSAEMWHGGSARCTGECPERGRAVRTRAATRIMSRGGLGGRASELRASKGMRHMGLRIGVIGTGVMGAEHARILREETRGAHLAAVADTDPARAADAAFGADVFTDLLELIAADGVDAVVIAA